MLFNKLYFGLYCLFNNKKVLIFALMLTKKLGVYHLKFEVMEDESKIGSVALS